MKSNLLKFYVTVLMLFVSFMGFSQVDPPGDDDLPLNTHLIWLTVAGVLLAVVTLRNFKKIKA